MYSDRMSLPDDAVILSVNPGHDGAVVGLKLRRLLFSREAEHDSRPRHMPATAYALLDAMTALDDFPSVVATSGWIQGFPFQSATTPYHGVSIENTRTRPGRLCGNAVTFYESTHERSHLFCSYGMSPFPQGQPCYALTWEGDIGSFYEIDNALNISKLGPTLPFPGYKYSFLYDLADPSALAASWRLDTAGKLMALAAFSQRRIPSASEREVITKILRDVVPGVDSKTLFRDTRYFNCGVTDPAFLELVWHFSNALFDAFYSLAFEHLTKGYPLLIAGGCGLNCEWNSKWLNSGLFSDVFVPPVTNDSGSAIGTAIDAQHALSGCAKIDWNVYSGADFIWDSDADVIRGIPVDVDDLVDRLLDEKIIAWVDGRSEIGPRALGHRSLLASPFNPEMKKRLNMIKQREWYRPIAPICLNEDAYHLFGAKRDSPFMLYFQHNCPVELKAVAHVDGSARVQTVSEGNNPPLYQLLRAFKKRTGFGVLCNTSLNRKGRGFINRSSDLFEFALEKQIEAVVVSSRLYLPTRLKTGSGISNEEITVTREGVIGAD